MYTTYKNILKYTIITHIRYKLIFIINMNIFNYVDNEKGMYDITILLH